MQFLKKIMTILFSCVILGSMTACGGGADSSKDSASENTPTASGMFNPTLTVDQKTIFPIFTTIPMPELWRPKTEL